MMTSTELFWYLNAMWGTALVAVAMIHTMYVNRQEDVSETTKTRNAERLTEIDEELADIQHALDLVENNYRNLMEQVRDLERDKTKNASSSQPQSPADESQSPTSS